MNGCTAQRVDLVESHAHLLQLGRSLSMADLSGCESAAHMIDVIAAHSRGLAPDAWVLGHGARPESWADPAWPSIEMLDRAVDGRALCAWCFDYHALVASSSALRRATIDASSRFAKGRVDLDASGRPTGLLIEHAALALWERVPEPDPEIRTELVRSACDHLRSLGFAEVHDMKAQPWLGRILRDLDDAGELAVSVRLYALLDDLEQLHASRSSWQNDRVSLAGGKIFTDGTLNSRTAHMLSPYADAPPDHPSGMAMMSADEIRSAVRTVDAMGLPLAAHAIGDGAVRATLDAIESVRPRSGPFRIEHAELIDREDVPRFAQLGVVASLQPCHLLADIEALRRAVPDRLDRVLPIRELIDAGLKPGRDLVFGSDVPIVRADPDDSVRAAVDRRREGMQAEQAVSFEQSIDEPVAWACFARV
ncbi:MAG: amidohydrolase family protein [Planctomycetota bacterium]